MLSKIIMWKEKYIDKVNQDQGGSREDGDSFLIKKKRKMACSI